MLVQKMFRKCSWNLALERNAILFKIHNKKDKEIESEKEEKDDTFHAYLSICK